MVPPTRRTQKNPAQRDAVERGLLLGRGQEIATERMNRRPVSAPIIGAFREPASNKGVGGRSRS